MDLTHEFTVPVPVEEAWTHFNDIAGVAECFPGATVTSAEGDAFHGTVKVRLGPIALLYNGSGTFVEKDGAAHRFVVEAKGKDKRGNGTAAATVTLAMAPAGDTTAVEVLTKLAITGKPAQFGRGVMQDVSDKLLGQFVDCLEHRFTDAGAGAGTAAAEPGGEPPDAAPAAGTGEAETEPVVPAGEPTQPTQPTTRQSADAINLGTTVLPVLARTYWKPALVVLAVLVLLIWLIWL